jgi:hypothetical protein
MLYRERLTGLKEKLNVYFKEVKVSIPICEVHKFVKNELGCGEFTAKAYTTDLIYNSPEYGNDGFNLFLKK